MFQPEALPGASDTGWHRRVLALAAPIILANLSQPMLSLIDTMLAGHLPGPQFLGGVALATTFFNFVYWGFGFLRMTTTGLVAQAEGASDQRELSTLFWRGIVLAATLGLVLILLQQPLIYMALHLLGGSQTVIASAFRYCDARIWSAPAALANYVLLGTLLGRRQVHRALVLQVSINVVNAAAATTAVYGFNWGVAGLGSATAFADWFGLVLGLRLVLPQIPIGFPPWAELGQRSALIRLALINRDIFLRTLFLLLGFGWFTHASASIGDIVLAANAVLLNLQTFMAYGLDGFAHVAEALVGAAVGRHDRALLARVASVTTQWAGIVAGCFSATYFIGGDGIINVLTNQPDINAMARVFLPWAAASPLISVWSFQLDGIFIGATRTTELRNSAFLSTSVYILVAIALQRSLGNHGLWLAFSFFMLLRGLSLAIHFPSILRSLS